MGAESDFYDEGFPPADLTDGFAVGNNSVRVEVIDLVGPTMACRVILYLVPADISIPIDRNPAGYSFWQNVSEQWRWAVSSRPVFTDICRGQGALSCC